MNIQARLYRACDDVGCELVRNGRKVLTSAQQSGPTISQIIRVDTIKIVQKTGTVEKQFVRYIEVAFDDRS